LDASRGGGVLVTLYRYRRQVGRLKKISPHRPVRSSVLYLLYQVKLGPSTPVKDEVMDWMKGSNLPNNPELEKKLRQLLTLSEADRKQIAATMDTLDLDH
jgi:hypothetical protein